MLNLKISLCSKVKSADFLLCLIEAKKFSLQLCETVKDNGFSIFSDVSLTYVKCETSRSFVCLLER